MRAPLLVIVMLMGWATPAFSAPKDELRDAENSYLYGDYPRVVEKLTPLVEPDILLPEPDQQARAYELLGLAHFFLDEPPKARKFFERLIRFRPDRSLDPVLVPPPVVSFFDEIKASLAGEIAATRAALRKQKRAEAERLRRAKEKQISRIRVNSQVVAALPFGAGQFQNGDDALGTVFLATELVAIGTSVGLYIGIEQMRRTDGRFAQEDVDRVEAFQYGQLSSGWLAIGVMALGVAHALYNFEPVKELRAPQPEPPGGTTPGVGPTQLTWRF